MTYDLYELTRIPFSILNNIFVCNLTLNSLKSIMFCRIRKSLWWEKAINHCFNEMKALLRYIYLFIYEKERIHNHVNSIHILEHTYIYIIEGFSFLT
jgi:hypothetical protein